MCLQSSKPPFLPLTARLRKRSPSRVVDWRLYGLTTYLATLETQLRLTNTRREPLPKNCLPRLPEGGQRALVQGIDVTRVHLIWSFRWSFLSRLQSLWWHSHRRPFLFDMNKICILYRFLRIPYFVAQFRMKYG